MYDYRQIELLIRRARQERSVALGVIIGNSVSARWSGLKRLAARASATIRTLVETPDEYSTALPRRF